MRECREELAVTVEVGEVFAEVTHEYPDVTVHLTLFHARVGNEEPQRLEHAALRWIRPDEIDAYPFCPADEIFLKKIKRAVW